MSHGVKRQRESPEKEAARLQKEEAELSGYRTLLDDVMTRRSQRDFSREAFGLTTALLKKNPELYTVWNNRRQILLEGLFVEDPDQITPLLLSELQFLFLRLREYPKCYWIWLYRKWCLETSPDPDWDTELKLVTKMLEVDSRNFHGWGYRRYIVSSIEKHRIVSLAKTEFDYTTTKTNNISNFSAWHSRSNLIPHVLPPTTSPDFEQERKALLESELKRTQNGLWVDPDDQSTWLYHSWLLGETFSLRQQADIKPILAPTTNEEKVLVLQGEIQLLEDLLEEDPDSKWCLNSLSVYKIALARIQRTEVPEEVITMINKLEQGDPMRAGRYKDWRDAITRMSSQGTTVNAAV